MGRYGDEDGRELRSSYRGGHGGGEKLGRHAGAHHGLLTRPAG
jgi:hypothetical protein